MKRYQTILYVISAMLLILIGVELSLNLISFASLDYYRKLKLLHIYNESYLVGLAPNTDFYLKHNQNLWEGRFTTNSMGYRGSPEYNPSKKVLVCLGDSIVMGFGVSDEYTFCNGLNNISIHNNIYQAMNLGVDAFGSRGYSLRLKEASEKLPLNLVLFFSSPNDFTLPEELRKQGVLPDDYIDEVREKDPSYIRNFRLQFEATRISYSLMAFKLAAEQIKVKWFQNKKAVVDEMQDAAILPGKEDANFSKYLKSVYIQERQSSCVREEQNVKANCPEPIPSGLVCTDSENKNLPPLPEITRKYYDSMIELSRNKNFKLVYIMLPIQNEELYCGLHGKHHQFSEHLIRAGNYFKSKGITVIDLRKYIPEMCGEKISDGKTFRPSLVKDYIIPGDGHFTIPGNEWAKRSIIKEIKKLEESNAL